ncbi:hypothetical protein [Isachenkonia alkalipeptolytica]|uniref:Uncharacterized protein n=1 Tax=Isachenkonia alkalipeptolytica TaxID=2565777 RepID=A0AA43XMY4_9CLOT|nr:hypothetical protein [Isachenkonia alkalipeptolytica]NBG89416.1 hypothetical protein [Isachenkonia alkalipeptolytica]
MENILEMNGLETIATKIDRIKEGEPMEKTLTVQNETFVVTVDEAKSNKLTFVFNKAQDKIAQILRHQEVEKDIQKAKEQFHYGSFIG